MKKISEDKNGKCKVLRDSERKTSEWEYKEVRELFMMRGKWEGGREDWGGGGREQ